MFGFVITTKRELSLNAAVMQDQKAEIERLHKENAYEKARAEAAINALLMRSAKLAITPKASGLTEAEEDAIKSKTLDLFGDGSQVTEDEALEKLQS
jgi:hypothetical protein